MPVGPGKYRVVRRGGQMIRLHFGPNGEVNEAKNLNTGAVHSPKEFAADEKRRQQRQAEMNQKLRGG